MKKSLLSLAAVALFAISSNAQDGAPLYSTGDFEASNWDPANPVEFDYADGVYTLTVDGVSMLKVSTVSGDWEAFNGGALQVDGDSQVGENNLIAGDQNIVMPWSGDWTLEINSSLTVLTLSTTTPAPEGFTAVYVRGGMNGWGTEDEWKFETTDGNTYVLTGVTIEEGVEFKIADANWSKINYGFSEPIVLEEEYELDYNGGNITIAEGEEAVDVNLIFTLDTHSLLITTEEVVSYADVYVRGGMNGWGAEDAWKMATTDGVVYTLNDVVIPAGCEFKIADATWGAINYGADAPVILNKETELVYNGNNITLDCKEDVTADIIFNLATATILVNVEMDGISAIESNNSTAVYYNINGVRIDNPTNGFYIVKQGNKVSKTFLK